MATHSPPPGVLLLAQYLAREDLTHEALAARDPYLNRPLIGRILSGERARRVSVNLALALERATHGAVPVSSWERPATTDGPVVDRGPEYDQEAP